MQDSLIRPFLWKYFDVIIRIAGTENKKAFVKILQRPIKAVGEGFEPSRGS